MDTSDSKIQFDKNGVCDHCNTFFRVTKPKWGKLLKNGSNIKLISDKIRNEGVGKDYDCIIGISGGVDSSYLTYVAKEVMGLRPLIFHVDAGWNSEIAVSNIEKIIDKLGLDLYTEVIDWEVMKDLQLSFFKSGVSHLDMPQDHAFFATMYKFASLHNIKYILTGANFSTECVRNPVEWMYYQSDSRQLLDIHRKFGNFPLINFPLTSILWHKIWLPYIKNIKVIRPLDMINYNKNEAIYFLIDRFNWKPYPQKHFESRFTKFYESYWLTKRFNYDVRRVQYSSLILTEQMDRDLAIELLKSSPYDEKLIDNEISFISNKLCISVDELKAFIDLPIKTFEDYKNDYLIYKFGANVMSLFSMLAGAKR